MKKTVTLVELLVAISLLTVIVLGVGAFNIASRGLVRSSERKTQVVNELAFVLDHIHKNVLDAIGDLSRPGLIPIVNGFSIIQDRNINTGNYNNTPANYGDDRTVSYIFDAVNHTITFQTPAGNDILTRHFASDPAYVDRPFSITLRDGGVEIANLILRFKPAQTEEPRDNPEASLADVNLATGIGTGVPTIFFSSFSQSLR